MKTVLQGGTREAKIAALDNHMARLRVLKQRIATGNGGPGNRVLTKSAPGQGRQGRVVRRRRVFRPQPRQQFLGRGFAAQRFPQRRVVLRRFGR